jgi:hypothetical protein
MSKPSLRKRALITLGTTGFIQCSGILVINNYGMLIIAINADTKNARANSGLRDVGPLLYKNLGFNTSTQLLYGAAWLTFALGLDRKTVESPYVPFSKLTYV